MNSMFNKRQTARFCSQLNSLLSSGMPLLDALQVIRGLMPKADKKGHLESIINRVMEGHQLSEATVGLLPLMARGSFRAAERAGNLEEVLAQLAKYYESLAELEEKLKGAMVYPCFVLILCLLVVLVLIFFILPGFNGLFADLGAELPMLTSVVLNFSDLLSQYWLVIVIAAAAMSILTFKAWKKRPEKFEKIILRAPLLGNLLRSEIVIQCFGTLGALLNGGTPVIEALTITAVSAHSPSLKSILFEARGKVENGVRISEALEECRFFPPEAIQMLKVGEGSGQLADMLLSAADFQAKEREVFLKRFTALLEPAMTLIVGVVVGFIVLAMFLPIVNMVSSLQ